MRTTRSFVKVLSLVLVMGVLVVGSAAYAVIGTGQLVLPEGDHHIQIGVPTVVAIAHVTEVGGATIPVWVKSSHFGNTMLTATRHSFQEYAFAYTPPAVSTGDTFDACGTAIVSYGNGNEGGYDTMEPCSPSWTCDAYPPVPAYLVFVDAFGAERACSQTGVGNASWSLFKKLYR